MKKLTHKGKDVKVVKIKRMDDCENCIFDKNCKGVSAKWEEENNLPTCTPAWSFMVKYLYA